VRPCVRRDRRGLERSDGLTPTLSTSWRGGRSAGGGAAAGSSQQQRGARDEDRQEAARWSPPHRAPAGAGGGGAGGGRCRCWIDLARAPLVLGGQDALGDVAGLGGGEHHRGLHLLGGVVAVGDGLAVVVGEAGAEAAPAGVLEAEEVAE